jgi:cytochrome c-type biogenesis protein CcmH/NrfG
VARPIQGVLEEVERLRGTVHELVGESKIWEALDCLAKARALAEGTSEERSLRILTWETQAKLPSLTRQAHQNLEELASTEPADVAVHSALGRLYREAGLSARSRMAFKRVLTLDPQNQEAAAALQALGDAPKPR